MQGQAGKTTSLRMDVDFGFPEEEGFTPDPLGGNVSSLRHLAPSKIARERPVGDHVFRLAVKGVVGLEIREVRYDHHRIISAAALSDPVFGIPHSRSSKRFWARCRYLKFE